MPPRALLSPRPELRAAGRCNDRPPLTDRKRPLVPGENTAWARAQRPRGTLPPAIQYGGITTGGGDQPGGLHPHLERKRLDAFDQATDAWASVGAFVSGDEGAAAEVAPGPSLRALAEGGYWQAWHSIA